MSNEIVVTTNSERKALSVMVNTLGENVEKLPRGAKTGIVALGAHAKFISDIDGRAKKFYRLVENIKILKESMIDRTSAEYKLLCKVETVLTASFQSPLAVMKDYLNNTEFTGTRSGFLAIADTASSMAKTYYKPHVVEVDYVELLENATNNYTANLLQYLVEGGIVASDYRADKSLFQLSMYGYESSRVFVSFGRIMTMLMVIATFASIWFLLMVALPSGNSEVISVSSVMVLGLSVMTLGSVMHYVNLYRDFYKLEPKGVYTSLIVSPYNDSWSDSRLVKLYTLAQTTEVYGSNLMVTGGVDSEFIELGNNLVHTIVYGTSVKDHIAASKLTLSPNHVQKPVQDLWPIKGYENEFNDLVEKYIR